ncbi:MAG: glycosyltransferase [Lentisphaerae bacterium]|nr:glycosyltransferase [Lentisphaerota bacterium]
MDVVMVANAWGAAQDNPTSKHQIARELVRAGHRVLWVEGAGMRRPSLGSGTDRGRMWRKIRVALQGARRVPDADLGLAAGPAGFLPMSGFRSTGGAAPGLWVLAPLLIPLPALGVVRRFNGWLFRWIACGWTWRLGFRDPVLINYVPVLAGMMKGWGGRDAVNDRPPLADPPSARPVRTVYHCVDRWDQFGMYDQAMMEEMDRQCRAHADLVIASSSELEAHCRRDHGNVHGVSHGVNFEHFERALSLPLEARPVELPDGPVIGFIGLLSEWVDQELILAVARARPDAYVILIGKADVAIDRLQSEPNIRVIGPRPYADLPYYVAQFSVGLIPFVVSELTRAVNPIKLREMLAAGCPVVSTALPEVARFASPPGVHIATDAADFVAAVTRRVEQPLSLDERRALSDSMRGETWAVKTRDIVALIEGKG